MVAMNLRRLGVCNKFIQQILRHANVTTTMNIDVKTHSEWHEEPGNDVCNYCATREARQHTNHVEVFLGSSQQISGGEGGIILRLFPQLSCFLSLRL